MVASASINGELRAVVVIASSTCVGWESLKRQVRSSAKHQVRAKNRDTAKRMKGNAVGLAVNWGVWQEKMQHTNEERTHGDIEPANLAMDSTRLLGKTLERMKRRTKATRNGSKNHCHNVPQNTPKPKIF